MKRLITFVSGTRADFGKMSPLIRMISQSSTFDYEIVATGMHLLRNYGSTINEIYKAGFDNVFPVFNQDTGLPSRMDLALASTMASLSHYVMERKPDLVVAHGDRIEALATVIVATLNNIRVAHLEGGEVSGTIDESIRHSITKLAYSHLVANETSRKRLLQMGEEEERVHVIGSPEVDVMLSNRLPSIDDVQVRYNLRFEDFAIISYHPVTTEPGKVEEYADELFSAVEDSHLNYVIIRPNNDSGSDKINRRIERLKDKSQFHIIPSMRFEYFLSALFHSRFIIGNSSSGVREAPVYGVPTVNVGSRQESRFNYPGIFNVGENRHSILNVINTLPYRVQPVTPFGEGNSAESFLSLLRQDSFWSLSLQKRFVDR